MKRSSLTAVVLLLVHWGSLLSADSTSVQIGGHSFSCGCDRALLLQDKISRVGFTQQEYAFAQLLSEEDYTVLRTNASLLAGLPLVGQLIQLTADYKSYQSELHKRLSDLGIHYTDISALKEESYITRDVAYQAFSKCVDSCGNGLFLYKTREGPSEMDVDLRWVPKGLEGPADVAFQSTIINGKATSTNAPYLFPPGTTLGVNSTQHFVILRDAIDKPLQLSITVRAKKNNALLESATEGSEYRESFYLNTSELVGEERGPQRCSARIVSNYCPAGCTVVPFSVPLPHQGSDRFDSGSGLTCSCLRPTVEEFLTKAAPFPEPTRSQLLDHWVNFDYSPANAHKPCEFSRIQSTSVTASGDGVCQVSAESSPQAFQLCGTPLVKATTPHTGVAISVAKHGTASLCFTPGSSQRRITYLSPAGQQQVDVTQSVPGVLTYSALASTVDCYVYTLQ